MSQWGEPRLYPGPFAGFIAGPPLKDLLVQEGNVVQQSVFLDIGGKCLEFVVGQFRERKAGRVKRK